MLKTLSEGRYIIGAGGRCLLPVDVQCAHRDNDGESNTRCRHQPGELDGARGRYVVTDAWTACGLALTASARVVLTTCSCAWRAIDAWKAVRVAEIEACERVAAIELEARYLQRQLEHTEEITRLDNGRERQVLRHPHPLLAVAALNGLTGRSKGKPGVRREELLATLWR